MGFHAAAVATGRKAFEIYIGKNKKKWYNGFHSF
jgi:hypothetical protein